MYIKYSSKAFQNDNNLREIITQSGEVLGTYETNIDENGAKTKINIVLGDNCLKVTEAMITESFDEKNKMLLDISNNQIIKKTDNQLKLEKLTKMQSSVLEKLKDVRGAISAQGETNKVKEKKGKTPVYAISEDDIEIIGDYQHQVATFHETWNPDNFTFEQINESMFNGNLVLPEIVTRLF
jgi:hypothetical protein